MKRFVIVLLSVGLVLAGCSGPDIKKKDPTAGIEDDTSTETKTATTSTSGGGGAGGDNVQVLTGGGAGSATPVTGGENMGGGGGGVNNAAKDQANRVKTKVTGDDHGADDDANTGAGD
jgi:hypothetical protein